MTLLMKRLVSVFCMSIALLVVGGWTTQAEANSCVQPAGASGLQTEMVNWINQQREAKGLRRLAVSAPLRAAAQGHACDMAVRGYFSHQRAGGPDLSRRVKSAGFRLRRAAENIAKTQREGVAPVAEIWRNSSEHWANILHPNVSEIGIGIASSGPHSYWVMNIGQRR